VAAAGPEDQSIAEVLRRADKALYHAKHAGRDRVEIVAAESSAELKS